MFIEHSSIQRDAMREQVAVVTGAGQGIGRETARILAQLGASVVIAEINDSGREAEREIVAGGGRALFVQTDVADAPSVEHLRRQVQQTFGAATMLVNNAEAYLAKPLVEHTLAEWDRIFAVNLRGAYLCIRAFLPGMLAHKRGVIVTLESADGMPFISAYAASKVGLRSLATSLAAEVADESGVSVFCFGPGIVDTPGARKAFRELAPHYGLSEQQFIQQSGLPLISAELSATGLVGTLLYAREFHGQETAYVAGLTRLGLSPHGEPERRRDDAAGMSPATIKHRNGGSVFVQAAALNRQLEDILRANAKEFGDMPLFIRPVIKRMFQQGTGVTLEQWLKRAQQMTRGLESQSLDAAALSEYAKEVRQLAGFITKQEADARGWIKDPQQLRAALDALAGRKQTVLQLAGALGVQEPVMQSLPASLI